jgi:glutathione S-transferase
MRIYQFVLSPFAIKVRAALTLKGVAVELVDVTLERYAELLRVNPRAKVPVLVDGETVIPDSTAILEYLERRFPDPPLVPHDAARRARTLLLEDWADESLYFIGMYFLVHPEENATLVRTVYVQQYPPAVGEQVAGQILDTAREQTHQQGVGRKPVAEVQADLARHASMLAGLLGIAPYFGGEAPDLADCAVYGQCRLLARTPQGAALVAGEPLASWFRRMHAFDPKGIGHEPYATRA